MSENKEKPLSPNGIQVKIKLPKNAKIKEVILGSKKKKKKYKKIKIKKSQMLTGVDYIKKPL